jgi:pyridoxine 4-dehydrogenase
VMKRALELGANYWNGGEFYGPPQYNSLHLLKAYFEKYPEDVDKVVINIKGGMNVAKMEPDGTAEGIRKSVENCVSILGGVKKIDIFEAARVDPNVPIEETMATFQKLIAEGKIGGVALSEVRAETIRRAAKVQEIAGGVEIEFSLFTPEPLTNGVFEACAELNIPIIAYSPLGRGFLVSLGYRSIICRVLTIRGCLDWSSQYYRC